MTSDSAVIAWYVHRNAPEGPRRAVAWPPAAREPEPPDYRQRLSTEQLARLLEQVTRVSSPLAPYRAGLEASRKPATLLSLLLRSSETVPELLERATRYWTAFSSSTRLEPRTYDDRLELVLVESWNPRTLGLMLFTHYLVGALVGSLAEYTGGAVSPREVLLPGQPTVFDPDLGPELGVPVRYGSDLTRVVFPREIEQVRLVTGDPVVGAFLEKVLEQDMERLRLGVTSQVDDLVRRHLSEGLGMRETARQLGLSERTLRRRLEEEGTSFRERLDHVRRTRAMEMLAHHDVQSVARELGFVDARSFQRAFRRWTQMTPLEYRRKSDPPPPGSAPALHSPLHH